jgi:ABC-type polysaccharide/polyol phosphate export permease
MNTLIFILTSYGITNILIFGSIFASWRNFWNKVNPSFFGKLFTCPMCLSTWVGIALSTLFTYYGYQTPFTSYGIDLLYLKVFLDGCFTSGCVWIIHNLEEAFERHGKTN